MRKHRGCGFRLRGQREVALERSGAVGDADPGVENEGVALLESDGGLDGDLSHRVRQRIFDEIPYLVRKLSVFRPGNLPWWLPELDVCGGAHRDQELKGDTHGTQFRQVRAVRCVIPYVMYAA